VKLETLLVFGVIFAALLIGAELLGERSDCIDRGGVMVRTVLGVECVRGKR
jgi:hypothetical protein